VKDVHKTFVRGQVRFAIFAGTRSSFWAVGQRLDNIAEGRKSEASSEWASEASARATPQPEDGGHAQTAKRRLVRGRSHVAGPD
jgi:hypothetical protein